MSDWYRNSLALVYLSLSENYNGETNFGIICPPSGRMTEVTVYSMH